MTLNRRTELGLERGPRTHRDRGQQCLLAREVRYNAGWVTPSLLASGRNESSG
jgi:hypothetical protein